MRRIVTSAAAGLLAALALWADGVASTNAASAQSAMKFATPRDELMMRINGGFVEKPNSQKGRFVIIDAQKTVSRESLEAVAKRLDEQFTIHIDVVPGKVSALGDIEKVRAAEKAVMAVAVTELEGVPGLLAAPDCRWAVANVSAVRGGEVEKRVRVLVMKAFAYVAGAGSSQFPVSVMAWSASAEALEEYANARVPGDVQLRVIAYLRNLGVRPYKRCTYKRACREGWAPAPTNEFQKVVWEKVREEKERGPTHPIKIQKKKPGVHVKK